MKKALLIAAALFAVGAGAAMAQTAPADIVATLDSNHDNAVQRAEYDAMVTANFARIDTNHDGRLSGDERPSYHGQVSAEIDQAAFVTRAGGVFEGEDANHDGVLSGEAELTSFRNHVASRDRPVEHH